MIKKICMILLLTITAAFASESFKLNKGWNLNGSYLDNVAVEQFNSSNIITVWKWTGAGWEIYSPDSNIVSIIKNYGLSTFSAIDAGDGFWINAKNSDNITVNGDAPENTILKFSSGWTLASLKLADTTISTSQLTNDNISTVWKWGGNTWKIFSPNSDISNLIKNYGLSQLSTISSGEGFWINATGDVSISPPGFTFIAVDPYIEGAVFFEDKNGNGVPDEGEQYSNPSNENGEFTFSTPLSPDSIITMIEQGSEDGEVFDGVLKTTLDMCDTSTERCIASPLTTLVANGLTKQQVIDILAKAGINITMEDFKKNPMKDLKNKVVSALIDSDFEKLRANMMLTGFMNILKKMGKNGFWVKYEDFDNETIDKYLLPYANLVKGALNVNILTQIDNQLAAQIPEGINYPPVTADVIIKAANAVMHFVVKKAVAQIAEGATPDFQALQSLIASKAVEIAKKYYATLNADKFSPNLLPGIKQMSGLSNLKKDMFFKIFDNSSVESIEKGKFFPFKPEYVSDTVLISIGKFFNKIIKFYDNNTVEFYKFIKSTKNVINLKGKWKIDNGTIITEYIDKDGEKFGALIFLIANGIDSMRVKVVRYQGTAFLDSFNITYSKVRKCQKCMDKLKNFGFVLYPFGKEAFFISNPIDNATGKGTGKYFEYFSPAKVFVQKGVFSWYLNHLGGIVREYSNGTIMEVYILWSNDLFASGIIRKTGADGTNSIYPFFSKRKVFKKTFKDIDFKNKIAGIFDEDGFDGLAFFDNNSSLVYINGEEDNVSVDNLTWSIDNTTGWLGLSDGTYCRLLAFDNQSDVLFVDNHFPDENYLNETSLEKWVAAKQFPDNMTGTFVIVDDNKTETLTFFDNGTGVYSGDEDFNFNYSLSNDNMTLTLFTNELNVKFYLLNKENNKYGVAGIEGTNGSFKDVFFDIWTKQ